MLDWLSTILAQVDPPALPFDPDFLTRLGVIGLLGVAVYALYRGLIVSRSAYNERIALDLERIVELQKERDEWKERSLASDDRLDKFADALEAAIGFKVPS